MSHSAFPTTADLTREADAEDRDVADLVALHDLRRIVADAIARAGRFDGIRHPDRRWTTPPPRVPVDCDGSSRRCHRCPRAAPAAPRADRG